MSFKFTPSCCCSGYQCGSIYGSQTIMTSDLQSYADAMFNMVGDPRDQWFQTLRMNDASVQYISGYYGPDGYLPDNAVTTLAELEGVMIAAFQNCKRITPGPHFVRVITCPLASFTIDTRNGGYGITPTQGGGTQAYFNLILNAVPTLDFIQWTKDHGHNYPFQLIRYEPTRRENWVSFKTSGQGNYYGTMCSALVDKLNDAMGTTVQWQLYRASGGDYYATAGGYIYDFGEPRDTDNDLQIRLWVGPYTLRLYCSGISQAQADSFVATWNANPADLQSLQLAQGEEFPVYLTNEFDVEYWGAENVWGQ